MFASLQCILDENWQRNEFQKLTSSKHKIRFSTSSPLCNVCDTLKQSDETLWNWAVTFIMLQCCISFPQIRDAIKHCQRLNEPEGWVFQRNFFRSYRKFKNKSWSNFIFIVSTKHQLQNINQTSSFWQKLQNLDQTLASKSALNYCQHVSHHQHQQQ